MNEHLRVVFEQVLSRLEEAGIIYWIWGGMGVAGAKGKIYRENSDIDIIVKDSDWAKTKEVCHRLASSLGFKYCWMRKILISIKSSYSSIEKKDFLRYRFL